MIDMKNNLLSELSYRLPVTGPAAFWDFYALNYLWFRVGSGHESMYGNKLHPGQIPTHQRQHVIDDVFEKCARDLLKNLSVYLIHASVKEFHNYTENSKYYNLPTTNPLRNKLIRYDKLASNSATAYDEYDAVDFYEKVKHNMELYSIDTNDIRNTFLLVPWEEYYGGTLWVKILDLATLLLQKQTNMPLKDVVSYIDKIYDMEHNTGSVLNKGKWEVLNTDLDKRHDIKDIQEFLPHVTHSVKMLIKNNLRYFNADKNN